MLSELIAASGLDATDAGRPGDDMVYLSDLERTLGLFAAALDRLADTADLVASTPPDPVWGSPERIVTAAAAAAEADLIDTSTFTQGYRNLAPQRLVDALAEGADHVARRSDRPVLSHGDVGLPTLRLEGVTVLGFSEWSAVAVADRHRDLAGASRYLLARTGPGMMPTFVSGLRHQPDPVLLDWYLLAVQLIG